jgi:cell division protein ZapB
MAKIEDLAERVDRLVLRHQELKRTTALIAEQLVSVTSERDSLKSRLAAARARVDALLERLPAEDPAPTADLVASNIAAGATTSATPSTSQGSAA